MSTGRVRAARDFRSRPAAWFKNKVAAWRIQRCRLPRTSRSPCCCRPGRRGAHAATLLILTANVQVPRSTRATPRRREERRAARPVESTAATSNSVRPGPAGDPPIARERLVRSGPIHRHGIAQRPVIADGAERKRVRCAGIIIDRAAPGPSLPAATATITPALAAFSMAAMPTSLESISE